MNILTKYKILIVLAMIWNNSLYFVFWRLRKWTHREFLDSVIIWVTTWQQLWKLMMMTLGLSTLNVWHLCYRITGAVVLLYMKRKLFAALFEIVQSSVQFSSVAQSCLTLCNPMNHSTPGLPVHHQLPEFTQTYVHWVGDAIQPSPPLSSPSPPVPNPSHHQSLFQWVNSLHQVA